MTTVFVIVKFYSSSTKKNVFFFSMEGGELFSRIQERADCAFTERGNNNRLYTIVVIYCVSYPGVSKWAGTLYFYLSDIVYNTDRNY